MRRALLVAADRGLTRAWAEALGGPDPGFVVARAHSALEARVLVDHHPLPFDVVALATQLPDDDPLSLLEALRARPRLETAPLFLMSGRGRDARVRRAAAARFGLAGVLELPATPDAVAAALSAVQRRRRILVLDPEPRRAEAHQAALERAGFVVAVEASARALVDRIRQFDPDLVALALFEPPAPGPQPVELCAALKRRRRPPKVLLYGDSQALAARAIPDNFERADDFLAAPFAEESLVLRSAALVGLGAPDDRLPAPRSSAAGATRNLGVPAEGTRVDPATPPPASETAPGDAGLLPPRRSSRRVPCEVTLSLEADGRLLDAQTLDISPGGMFFAIDPPPSVGATVALRFHLADASAPIEAEGRVAWVGRGPSEARGAGVEFTRIETSDLERIVTYVERLSGVLYGVD